MFRRCRMEYFLHYCGAAGGADLHAAARETILLHRVRSLRERNYYARELFFTAVRTLFRSGETDGERLRHRVLAGADAAFDLMLARGSEKDHRIAVLRELAEFPADRRQLRRELLAHAEDLCRNFHQSVPFFFSVPKECRLKLPFPLAVKIGEITAYCTAAGAFTDNGNITFLLTGSSNEENAVLAAFYAMHRLDFPPEKCRILFFDGKKAVEYPLPLSFSAVFRRIRKEFNAMKEFRKRLNEEGKEALPFQEHGNCSLCRFKIFCGF